MTGTSLLCGVYWGFFMRCFCCSSLPFSSCCEPYLSGSQKPQTAEALMRSRFSAYATQNYQYILDTYSTQKRTGLSLDNLKESAAGTHWFALAVKNDANPEDIVEFTAFYFESKQCFQLHETSRFIIENGEWRYHDGELHNDCGKVKLGRNLPCPCNSGKKFKQCCGKKAN